MTTKKLVTLYKFRLDHNDMSKLSHESLAVLGLSSFAITEINFFQRLFLMAPQEIEGEEEIDTFALSQKMMIVRNWSAKLFEYQKFCKGFKASGEDSEILRKIFRVANRCLSRREKNGGSELFRIMRDDVTNHYVYKAAKKNVPHLSRDADYSVFLHETLGNRWFPLGEELMFAGRLNRHTSNRVGEPARIKVILEWLDYNQTMTEWAQMFHTQLVRKVLFPKFENRKTKRTDLWLPVTHVGKIDDTFFPLFLHARN